MSAPSPTLFIRMHSVRYAQAEHCIAAAEVDMEGLIPMHRTVSGAGEACKTKVVAE